MQDRPTQSELLQALAELLDEEVKPAVSGLLQHKVRVGANLCRILEREARMGAALETREVELLEGLTGETGTALELSTLLCSRLDGSDIDLERSAWPALLEIVRGRLAVAKPGHDAYDFRAELAAEEGER